MAQFKSLIDFLPEHEQRRIAEQLQRQVDELRADPKYAAEKRLRDRAWDEYREREAKAGRRTAGVPAEVVALERAGYFGRAAEGDHKGSAYFAMAAAHVMNPRSDPSLPGRLAKGGGQNVEGFAEDAIVLNADPGDLLNVVDMVAGAGAPGARLVWNGPLPRRSSDVWAKPVPLTSAQLTYLGVNGAVDPQKPPVDPQKPTIRVPDYEAVGGDGFHWRTMGDPFGSDYLRKQDINAGISVWFGRVMHRALRYMVNEGMEYQAAVRRATDEVRPELRRALGIPDGGW